MSLKSSGAKIMSERLTEFRKALAEKSIDAMLITDPVNRLYLSGFEGSSGVLLIGRDEAFLVTDFRYLEQAAAQAGHFSVRRWQDDLYKNLVPIINEAGWKKIGFEAKNVIFSAYQEMQEKLPVELIPVEDAVEKKRMRKSEAEIEALRSGARVLDRAYEFILSFIKPGLPEKQLALELEIFLLRQGAQERSFQFIVASGERGAMPHGTASNRLMREGELVTIDYGAVFNSYATDMTRTLALGRIDQKQRDLYNLVLEAQQEAVKAVKPGMKASELDAVARNIIDQAGYANYFGHGLGHGIGLETHEQPVLNPRSVTVLEPGMTVTIEPGIYIKGWCGIRIEDMVAVTENGGEVLTKSPRDLTVI